MSDIIATAAAREIIEVAYSLEEWALEADGTMDEALTYVAIGNAVGEALEDIKRVWSLYADGYQVPVDALNRAHSILRNLNKGLVAA